MTTLDTNQNNLLLISRHNSTTLITSNYIINNSFTFNPTSTTDVGQHSPSSQYHRLITGTRSHFSKLIRSILTSIPIIPTFRWPSMPTQLSLAPSQTRIITGTLFGNRRGQVTFAVQNDPRSAPVLIIELAVTTAALVKEMSSGMVRIALECEKVANGSRQLWKERVWTMYCNGRKCGDACLKTCVESEWHVLSMVRSVSVGAGVVPAVDGGGKGGDGGGGELVFMRAKFERVVGSRDSEAYYMVNPDGNGGPELSIFMLRI